MVGKEEWHQQANLHFSFLLSCFVGIVEYYDFIIVVDRNVKEHIMRMAESFAHTTGGHLYEWERKVRLLCDFDAGMPHVDRVRSGIPLDVPSFESSSEVYPTMDLIKEGCESIVRSLVRAGL